MGAASYKVAGGKLINAQVRTRDSSIAYVRVTGDFFLHPEELIFEIESSLMHRIPDEDDISMMIEHILTARDGQIIGATPRDFAKVITEASK